MAVQDDVDQVGDEHFYMEPIHIPQGTVTSILPCVIRGKYASINI